MSAPGSCTPPPRRAFYCVADRRYFVGAVALLNSLRVVGHSEPLIVLDRGLEPGQRAALEPVATVLSATGSGHGRLSKTLAPLAWPAAEVLAIVDADVIALRSLDALLERAAGGQVVAFADDQPERFHPEWRRALGVSELHRHTYVNAGLLLLPGDLAPAVLARVSELHERVDFSRSRGFGRGTMADPFRLPDQDCWNAALAGTVEPSRMTVLDRALAPFQPWEPARIEDARTLSCRVGDGRRPYLLHHIGPKPWRAERQVPASAYSTLLPRLLHGEDVTLALERPAPAVSVIVPTHQRRAAVRRAVDSVLAQSYRDFELIVVDDGSEDGTDAVLAPLAPLLRYVRQPNRGPAAARNAGLRLARGEIVAFLDSDDRWLSGHLSVIAALFHRHPDAVLACTAPAHPRRRTALGRPELLAQPFPEILTRAIAGAPSATAVRRTHLEATEGFDEALPDGSEDRDLWRRLALRGPFVLLRRRTVVLGGGEDSLSRRSRQDGTALVGFELSIRRLERRLQAAGGAAAAAQVAGLRRYLEGLALLRAGRGSELEQALAEAAGQLPGLSTNPALILDHLAQLEGFARPQVALDHLRTLAAAWPDRSSKTAVTLYIQATAAAARARRPRAALELLARMPHWPALALAARATARRLVYGASERVHDTVPLLASAGSALAGRWHRARRR